MARTVDCVERGVMRLTVLVVGVMMVVLLGAADCKSGGQPGRAPTPGAAQNNQPPADPRVNEPGPVQGDPSAHDPTPGEAEFHAVWKSETKIPPRIEYTLEAGGAPILATNLRVSQASDGYIAVWVFYVNVRAGQTIGFSLFGTSSTFHVECMVIHHGQFHSVQVSGRNCASSYTIP